MTSQLEQPGQESQLVPLNGEGVAAAKVDAAVVNPSNSTYFTQQSVLEGVEELRQKLTDEIEEYDQKDITISLQSEFAQLAVLLQRTERLVLRSGEKNETKLGELNNLICSLRVAMTSLAQKKPNLRLSEQIRIDVEQEVVKKEHCLGFGFLINQFTYAWRSDSTPLKVIYGLICSFVILFGSLSFLALMQSAIYASGAELRKINIALENEQTKVSNLEKRLEQEIKKDISENKTNELTVLSAATQNLKQRKKDADSQVSKLETRQQNLDSKSRENFLSNLLDFGLSSTISQILWVAAAGTLGSIVSILTRVIEEFHDKRYYDRLTPFCIGFFKPVIGASFGVLFLAFVNSGVVSTPFLVDSDKSLKLEQASSVDKASRGTFLLFAIAFIVGFSERLAKDTIGKLEGDSKLSDEKSNRELPPGSHLVLIQPGDYTLLKPDDVQRVVKLNETPDQSEQDVKNS